MHNKKQTYHIYRHAQRILMAMAIALGVTSIIAAPYIATDVIRVPAKHVETLPQQRADTLRRPAATSEVHDLRSRMMTSPQPVSIRQQGRFLKIESQTSQLLPIYTNNGTFYTAFRLTKGTNWLGGLPRGRYIINNQSFAIN